MTSNTQVKPLVSKDVAAGAAIYSNLALSVYDLEVLILEIPLVFKCPLKKLKDLYSSHVSNNHLEVGVGTGYFPDKYLNQENNQKIHLLDLNSNSLKKTSNRLKRYSPTCHLHNVFDPLPEALPSFDSIAIMNFLHCLPGTMIDKESVIINLARNLKPGGVIFGATALGEGVDMGFLYQKFNAFHNRAGIFTNLNDNSKDLEMILSNNFKHSSVEVVGSYALFYGHN